MDGMRRSRLVEGGWLLFWLVASSVWAVSAADRLGATFDEPCYVSLGLEAWRSGSSRRLLDLGTMPLPSHVQTLPLYVWERWRGEPFDAAADLDRLLPVARLGTLPFWWLLLIYGWRAGRQLGGVWGGRLAVAFLACEPNLLAHAGLATTDIAVTACLVALLYSFRAGRDGSWWARVLIPAGWFALAVLAKASGLVFGVLGLAVVELEYRLSQCRSQNAECRMTDRTLHSAFCILTSALRMALVRGSFRRDLVQISTIGLIAVFGYCGSDWCVSPSFVEWAHKLPDGAVRTGMVWFAEHLRIFSNAGFALVRQVRHNVQGHGVFLLDRVAKRAIWYYFPVALSIKTTLPILALPLLLAIACPRALWNWACVAALVFLVFSLVCRVQTGIRLVLPLLGLAVIGLAAALATARQDLARRRLRPLLSAAGALSGAWLLWSAVSVWPHGLCYTNELWGGTANGYRLLSDSNYDWGQGIKELADWQRENRIQYLDLLYYGTDTRVQQLPMRRISLTELAGTPDQQLPASFQGRTIAAGTSILYGSLGELNDDLTRVAHTLRRVQPIARTTTFFIYRFPANDKPATDDKVTRRQGDKGKGLIRLTLPNACLLVAPSQSVVTMSPCHPVTLSPCHPVTLSPARPLASGAVRK